MVPAPALPARSLTKVLFRLITSPVWVVAAFGVRVAVQVMPPSLELTLLSVPSATVRSALLKPVTASLKVMVTSEIPPIFRAGFATTMLAVGRWVSML